MYERKICMDYKDRFMRTMLKKNLLKLDKQELKLFYGFLVYSWANQKAFISTQSFRNLRREVDYLCYVIDDKFFKLYYKYKKELKQKISP